MRTYQLWSPAEDKRLLSLVQQGKTNAEIAWELKRPYRSVESRRAKLKPPPPIQRWPITDADTASRRVLGAMDAFRPLAPSQS